MKPKKQNTAPDLAVYVVEGEGERTFWTKVGSAWSHEDGEGLNVRLSALPLDGRLVIRKPKARTDHGEAGQ